MALLAERVDIATDGISVGLRVESLGGRARETRPASWALAHERKASPAPQTRKPDNALAKALALAFRCKRMLQAGEFAIIGDLPERERIAPSDMTRVLWLTLLAPDLVDAFLDGTQGPEVTLAQVIEPFPVEWHEQW